MCLGFTLIKQPLEKVFVPHYKDITCCTIFGLLKKNFYHRLIYVWLIALYLRFLTHRCIYFYDRFLLIIIFLSCKLQINGFLIKTAQFTTSV